MRYKYFLFDLDRTLWDFNTNAKVSVFNNMDLHPSLSHISKEDFFHSYEKVNQVLWSEYEAGIITKDILRWRRFNDTFNLYGIDDREMAKSFGDGFITQMKNGKVLFPGTLELLNFINDNGGKMAIITNGFKEAQRYKLNSSEIGAFFQEVIISEEVGYHKPSPEVFSICLEKLSGTSRNSEEWESIKKLTIMVGDDLNNDVKGGKNFGIDQFHFTSEKIGVATYEGNSLLILKKLLVNL